MLASTSLARRRRAVRGRHLAALVRGLNLADSIFTFYALQPFIRCPGSPAFRWAALGTVYRYSSPAYGYTGAAGGVSGLHALHVISCLYYFVLVAFGPEYYPEAYGCFRTPSLELTSLMHRGRR